MIVRPYTVADLPGLLTIQAECFPPPFPPELWWKREQIASHVDRFPAGALCVEDQGALLASATALIIPFVPAHPHHTWEDVADGGYLGTHRDEGNTLYGIDMAVRPAWRGRGLARMLYQARFDLVRRLGLDRFLAGSRLAGWHRHQYLTPEAYAVEVAAGRLVDPVITPQMRAGLRPTAFLPGYIEDVESGHAALLMEWIP